MTVHVDSRLVAVGTAEESVDRSFFGFPREIVKHDVDPGDRVTVAPASDPVAEWVS